MGILHKLLKWKDERRRRKSFVAPVICPHFRDAYLYFENGRSVRIQAEMASGDYDRILYPSATLRWDDTKNPLNDEERRRVMAALFAYFDKKNIRWVER